MLIDIPVTLHENLQMFYHITFVLFSHALKYILDTFFSFKQKVKESRAVISRHYSMHIVQF